MLSFKLQHGFWKMFVYSGNTVSYNVYLHQIKTFLVPQRTFHSKNVSLKWKTFFGLLQSYSHFFFGEPKIVIQELLPFGTFIVISVRN